MNSYLSLANEKMLFASLLLQQSGNARSQHLVRALLQSAVLQAQIAYRHHLREIAVNYNCRNADKVQDVAALIATLEASDKHPAEASEMLDLECRKMTWLAQLLSASRIVKVGPEIAATSGKAVSRRDLIPSQQLTDEGFNLDALDAAQVEDWLEKLREMVQRHRETMFEC